MRLGVHVSIAGGWLEALARASRLECRTMQIFSRSPRGGPAPPIRPDDAAIFHRERVAQDVQPLTVHAPYIINLASPDATIFSRSLALYREDYRRCAQLGAAYLVTHVGSHQGSGEDVGCRRVAEALNRTLEERLPAEGEPVKILLENTAGSGQGLGHSFEQLRTMRDHVERKEQVGFCLDTAHLFASGFPIHTPEGLEETVAAFERVVGFEHVGVIHLNDSKSGFNSHADRHWHIGEGQIGADAIGRIVNHPKLRHLPFILETPKDSEEDDRRNLAAVAALIRSHAESSRG